MEEWKEYRLGDFMEFNPKISLKKDTVARKITMDQLVPHSRDIYSWTYEPYSGGAKFQNGDTIMARITPCLENGKHAFISLLDENEIAYGSTEYIVMRGRKGISDNLFVYYLTHFPSFKDAAIKSMVGTSGRQRAQVDVVKNLTMKLPSIAEQKSIADILTKLDDKIAVNKQINDNFYHAFLEVMLIWLMVSLENDNLEHLAKKLFRTWCLNNIEDTIEFQLGDIADFTSGYSYKGNELVPSNVAMATIKNFDRNGGFKTDGFKEIQPSDRLKETQIAEKFDILVAHTDLTQKAEVIGNAELLLSTGEYEKIIFSMDLVKVLPQSSFPYRFLLAAILRTDEFKAHCLGYVNGTTVLHLSKKGLPEYVFNIPSSHTGQKNMNDILGKIYTKQSLIIEENRKMQSLRDSLLPKLMSGGLKVNENTL